MNKLLSRRVLLILSLLATIVFSAVLFELQLLPLKFYIPLVVIVLLIIFLLYRSENSKKNSSMKVVVYKLIHMLLSIVLIIGSLYAMKGSNFLSSVTGGGEQIIEMDVVALKSSGYSSLNDLKGLPFGANTSVEPITINKAETLIEDDIGDIDITGYTSNKEVINALNQKNVDALVVKSVDLESFDEIQKGFTDKVKVIKKIEIKVPGVSANSAKVTKEPFNILICGTDQNGSIQTFGLSDVNMIATINPVTKQVLLTSIPRDYFVDIVGMDGVTGKDKLTHSAKGGIDCTIQTVESLLGIQFNYYAKFNFTSFINVVDALGGVTIDVPKYDVVGRDDGVFTTKKGNYTIKPGKNQTFDAKKALCFVRERKAFVEGDAIRGKNQMLVMKAIIKKCCSPSILTKLDSVFESLSNSFETNLSAQEVKSLINMQIDDSASWDIQSYRLDGDTSQRATSLATVGDVTTVNPRGVFVTYPDEESVSHAESYIQTIMNNEILKVEKEETSSEENSTTNTTTQSSTNTSKQVTNP